MFSSLHDPPNLRKTRQVSKLPSSRAFLTLRQGAYSGLIASTAPGKYQTKGGILVADRAITQGWKMLEDDSTQG